jgi:hypothetical protein
MIRRIIESKKEIEMDRVFRTGRPVTSIHSNPLLNQRYPVSDNAGVTINFPAGAIRIVIFAEIREIP